jgi:ABC-2 type transport system permease protein
VSLDLGGSIIDGERTQQTFELLVIAPASFSRVLGGRVASICAFGMVTFAESIAVARIAFGVRIGVAHPLALAATLFVTMAAMAGTSTAMGALFVAARSARRFSNVMGYPFYILGGLLVPVTLLPPWLRPLSWLTYLFWSAGLLRDALNPAPMGYVVWRMLAVLGLGAAAYWVGLRLHRRVVDGLRRNGTIGLS